MSLISVKCPSCGADISLDDEKEYGFCSYCGTKIQNDAIKKLKIEYKGDPVSTTNVVYNIDNRVMDKPRITIDKPKSGRLILAIILVSLGILFLIYSITMTPENPMGYILSIVFVLIGVSLFVLYLHAFSLYQEVIKKAIQDNSVTNIK